MSPRASTRGRRAAIATCVAFAVFAVLAILGQLAGLRINTTRSIPLGVYLLTSDEVHRGAYVLMCPPRTPVFYEAKARGYLTSGECPGGFGPLMKKVLAAKGDIVAISDDGVRVNGGLVPYSAHVAADKKGRPLPRPTQPIYLLDERQLLLMSGTNPASFDGRYFGPVERSHVLGVIRPIFTWQGEN